MGSKAWGLPSGGTLNGHMYGPTVNDRPDITLSSGKVVRRVDIGMGCWRSDAAEPLTMDEWIEFGEALKAERAKRGKPEPRLVATNEVKR